MESIEFFQVFMLIMTLLYMYFRSLTSASSSSPSSVAAVDTDIPPLQEKYDVFLSFRGEDTRDTFTSHLHKALLGKKIETYMDYRLEKGEDIGPSLLEAIEKSKIALVIFSKDYASSTWCLKELVHILGCKKSHGQIVIPIFYRIDPSDVRKQKGTYELGGLLWRLKKRFKGSMDEVADWRAALEEAANMSGFHDSSKTGTEADFVDKVVQDVLTKLNRESSSDLKGLVGIENKIEKIESLLCLDSPGVCCVGIWGMGGIGKTTLAEAVFHRHASKFEAYCFLANVREKSEQTGGLNQLLNELVREILMDKDINIGTLSLGPTSIRDRLMRTKALIVLDDVNASNQLEVLVGDDDRFCQGSRIIITSRDKGLLEQKVDHEKIYNVEGLGSDDALRLFHSHAFGNNKSPTTDYSKLSREVMDYIEGIPLALKVMGSSFRRCKSKQEWEVQWKKVKRVPIGEIQKVLRISYDGLEDNEKEIFLDIACFYKGYMRNYVERRLDSCDFFGETRINDLIDRSLISISKGRWSKGLIEMYDLVQEMGRAIAREQCSRLFNFENVYQVLINNQRDERVQAISFDLHEIEKRHLELEHANFEKMYQLRWLRVFTYHLQLIVSHDLPNSLKYLHWRRYPLKSLPSKFSAQNLVHLVIVDSKVEGQLWNEDQSPVNLKRIDLAFSKHLTEVPNLSRSRKIEHIDLSVCRSLVEIPSYFQHLGKLTYLNLKQCINLKNLPEMPCNLEFLNLCGTAIEELPSSVWSHEKISHLAIRHCKHLKSLPSNTCKLKLSNSFSLEGCESLCEFWELPKDTTVLQFSSTTMKELRNESIESVVGFTAIKLISCTSLVSLPTKIWELEYLESLNLSGCSNLQFFPEISEAMEHLKFLNLSCTAAKELPPSIGNLVALQKLDLGACNNLVSLPTNIWKLKSLKMMDLGSCSKFQYFPEISEAMEHLEFLNLSCTVVKELPPSIGNLVALRKLDLGRCKNLEVVSDDLFRLTSLQVLNLSSTEIKSLPSSIKQAAQLSHLCLINCKSLESLPELPPLLQRLEADGCTSLKTVSSSSTTITQGWEESIFYLRLYEKHIFSNCPKLDENARSNIMGDAQLIIMRMATVLSKFKEDRIEEASYDSDEEDRIEEASYDSDVEEASYVSDEESLRAGSFVTIRCCGNEIPNWFSHKSEGSSIKIELPRDWFSTDFLGFALSLVAAAATDYRTITCTYKFKNSNDGSFTSRLPLSNHYQWANIGSRDSREVSVWWHKGVWESVADEAQIRTAFYKLVTEVNVDFTVRYSGPPCPEVEKCGICLLYGKDAEMIKQRALYAQDAEVQIFF